MVSESCSECVDPSSAVIVIDAGVVLAAAADIITPFPMLDDGPVVTLPLPVVDVTGATLPLLDVIEVSVMPTLLGAGVSFLLRGRCGFTGSVSSVKITLMPVFTLAAAVYR